MVGFREGRISSGDLCHNANDHQRLRDMFLTSNTTASYNIPVVSAHSKLSLICLFLMSEVIDIFFITTRSVEVGTFGVE